MKREEAVKILQGAIKKPNTKDGYLGQAIDMAIKALEQEPCEDAIYRQAVLKEIPALWNSNGDKDYCMESLRDFVSELSPVTPTRKEWIPVSERLPEEGEVVLCTNSSNDLFEAYAWDDCGETKWNSNGCFDVPVIAWMQLPEPYKADMRGGE